MCIRSILLEICPYPPLVRAVRVVPLLLPLIGTPRGGSRTQETSPRTARLPPEGYGAVLAGSNGLIELSHRL